MEIVPTGTKIDFLGKSSFAVFLSLMLVAASIYAWIDKGQQKFGIDFLGGNEFVVKLNDDVSSDQIREALNNAKVENAIVQAFELASHEYSIRLGVEHGDGKAAKALIEGALNASLKDKYSIIKSDFVGGLVGDELKSSALIALGLGLLSILIYVTVRFEFSYALGAVVALFHDVIICVGVYLLAGFTLTMGAVAAALTIIGYSVNDTIVIFDRVREEVKRHKNPNLRDIMNESVNVMLGRTIVTSGLTFFSALALLLVGGGAISDLSLFLVVGIFIGCYSTIYIASPVALAWERYRGRA
jgi:preprotein translocase SecF subunit